MRLLKLISVMWLGVAATVATANDTSLLPFSMKWENHATRGTIYNSADHTNGIFVIEAYFQACPACNANAQNVNDLATDYANEPRVQVLDVSRDRRDSDYAAWINRHKPNHPVLNDSALNLIRKLGTTGYPSTYILNCKGEVTYFSDDVWTEAGKAAIRAKINELLTTTSC